MVEDYPERPNPKRLAMLLILLVIVSSMWILSMSGFFDEPEEPEGIFVRFILLFKQSNLL